jgi:hypothetical protein
MTHAYKILNMKNLRIKGEPDNSRKHPTELLKLSTKVLNHKLLLRASTRN